ncbi:MAG: hypothetical protein GF334_11050 [Candidatus Altiarchaeales archaeon]|nr:hypothetical protein [Candidatus Altiarchaeales archaeon]
MEKARVGSMEQSTKKITSLTFLKELYDSSQGLPQCHPSVLELLNEEERAAVDVLYWLRNRHKGKKRGEALSAAIRTMTYTGPKGVYDKKGRWYAIGLEACDYDQHDTFGVICGDYKHVSDDPDQKPKYDHFASRNHCRTRQHLGFLVKYRKVFVVYKLIDPLDLALMVGALQKTEYPLLLQHHRPIIRDFAQDCLSGKFFSPTEPVSS